MSCVSRELKTESISAMPSEFPNFRYQLQCVLRFPPGGRDLRAEIAPRVFAGRGGESGRGRFAALDSCVH